MQNIIMQMIGELNASHTGVSGAPPNPAAIQSRFPGFELEADASGFYKVAFVYKDGPADYDYVRIHAGDFIVAIDGQPLHSGDNYWKNYNLAPGRKIEFTVNSKPSADGAWTTKVETASAGAESRRVVVAGQGREAAAGSEPLEVAEGHEKRPVVLGAVLVTACRGGQRTGTAGGP